MKQITTFIFFVLVTTFVQAQQPAKVRAEVGPTAEELKRQKELETFIAKQNKLSNLMRENNISAPSLMGFATNDKEAINRIIKTNQDLINKINGIAGLRSLSMEVHTMSKALGHKTKASTDYVTHILEKANENIRRGKARLTELENTPKNTDNKNVTVIKPIAPPKNNWGFEKPKEEQKVVSEKKEEKIENKVLELVYGSVKDIDGNTYKTLEIGKYIWMIDNLKTTKLNDGTSLNRITSIDNWDNFDILKYYYYAGNNLVDGQGFFYNVMTTENHLICPKGWRVPNHAEWNDLLGNNMEFFNHFVNYLPQTAGIHTERKNGKTQASFYTPSYSFWSYRVNRPKTGWDCVGKMSGLNINKNAPISNSHVLPDRMLCIKCIKDK